MDILIIFIVVFCVLNFIAWRDPEFKVSFFVGVLGLTAASIVISGGMLLIKYALYYTESWYILIFVSCCVIISAIIRHIVRQRL